MIRFDNVTKVLSGKTVLDRVAFEVPEGATFVVVGLSGAGKSVTLKHMIRLLRPDSGTVAIDGEEINDLGRGALRRVRTKFGVLFQSAALLQWMNVRDNVALPLRERTRLTEAEILEKVDEKLEMLGLADAREKFPADISGGMRKRVGLARAIIMDPKIVLYDEPTSGLDPVTSRKIDDLIVDMQRRLGITSVVVTHDLHSALAIGSRIMMLHEGRIVENADPAGFIRSKDPTVQSFLASKANGKAWAMNKYGREVTIEILVGLFMFTVLIALGIFTIVLSRENLLQPSHQYEFVFPEVSGLREGDNVYLRGTSVGRVKQLELEDRYVRVYVTLDVPLKLRSGYRIEVVNSSMLGGKLLKISEGPDDAEPLGDNVTILGSPPVDVIEQLGEAVAGIQRMIDAVSAGRGTLGKLLNDDTMYNNMVAVSEDLKSISSRLADGKGTLGRLLSADDEKLYDDTQATMANLRTITQNLADGKGTLGKLVSGEDTAYGDLEATLAAARSIAESISSGEGTLGKLVRDAQLYDETTLLVEDVRAAVDDLREASPITSFGSVLFGAF